MPSRTEERCDDLAHLSMKFKKIAEKKGLDFHEYLDILIVSICATAIRNNVTKASIFEVINIYWANMKKDIEAKEFSEE